MRIVNNKKTHKVIPLRDINGLNSPSEPENQAAKKWIYAFEVITKNRNYLLYAPTKAEKEMWVHAFNTILKYKKKAEEVKGTSKNKDMDEEVDLNMNGPSDDGFDDVEERKDRRRHSPDNEGDFMEDDRRRKQEKPQEKSEEGEGSSSEDSDLRPSREPDIQSKKESQPLKKQVKGRRDSSNSSEESKKSTKYKDRLSQKAEKVVKKQNDPRTEQKREDIIRQQQAEEEELRKRMQPVRHKRRNSPEVIEDESLSSNNSHHDEKENKHQKLTRHERIALRNKKGQMRENTKQTDSDEEDGIDIDKIIKRKPKEAMKLEPPSPPVNENDQNKNQEEDLPQYFTGFTANAKMKQMQMAQDKPKSVINKQLVPKDVQKEDLVNYWDKKYGKAKTTVNKDVWGAENEQQQKQQHQEEFQQKPKPKAKNKPRPVETRDPNVYVENVLASQPKIANDEFEENWDSD